MRIYQISYQSKPESTFSRICAAAVWPRWTYISLTVQRKLRSAVVGARGANRYWLALPDRPDGERFTQEDVRQLVRRFESAEARSASR
jgi:hypothetical protein